MRDEAAPSKCGCLEYVTGHLLSVVFVVEKSISKGKLETRQNSAFTSTNLNSEHVQCQSL